MKKLFIVLTALAFIAGVGVMKAEAANPATIGVTVTLTLAGVSVSVSPNSWTPTGVTTAPVTSTLITATNDTSNRIETLSIVCEAGSIWGISNTIGGPNTFSMQATGGLLTTATQIAETQILQTGVYPAGTVTFTLTFIPPTSSTVASDSMTVRITAS